jgi:hypothetical protein
MTKLGMELITDSERSAKWNHDENTWDVGDKMVFQWKNKEEQSPRFSILHDALDWMIKRNS